MFCSKLYSHSSYFGSFLVILVVHRVVWGQLYLGVIFQDGGRCNGGSFKTLRRSKILLFHISLVILKISEIVPILPFLKSPVWNPPYSGPTTFKLDVNRCRNLLQRLFKLIKRYFYYISWKFESPPPPRCHSSQVGVKNRYSDALSLWTNIHDAFHEISELPPPFPVP